MSTIFQLIWILALQGIQHVLANLVLPEVKTMVGKSAKLMCQTFTPAGDSIQLILWYQSINGTGPPFYTIDSRKSEGSLKKAIHSVSPKFKNRVHLNTSTQPSYLIIDPSQEDDSSYYSCRVDYKWSRTKISTSKLFVIVAPQEILIEEVTTGTQLSGVGGPYPEGFTLQLKCISNKGRPLPSLIWYLNDQMIDNSFTPFEHFEKVENELTVHYLTRDFFNSVLSCEARNYKHIPPISVSLRLDMYLKPLEVNIKEPKEPLRVNQSQKIVCYSKGSRPAPNLSWYIDNVLQNDSEVTISSNQTVTTSVISYTPSQTQGSVTFKCKAENKLIPNSDIQFLWRSELYFPPKLTLTLNQNNIVIVGRTIKLYCDAKANPKVTEIHWLFNDHVIEQSQGSNNATLIVNVTQSLATSNGFYQCVAMNSEGKSKSNRLHLNIYYQPICKQKDEKVIFELSLGETLNLTCTVDSQSDNLTFWWKFGNNLANLSSSLNFSNNQSISFQIDSIKKYGILTCGANNLSNSVQSNCQFEIVPEMKDNQERNRDVYLSTQKMLKSKVNLHVTNFDFALLLTIIGIVLSLFCIILLTMGFTRKYIKENKKSKKNKSAIAHIEKEESDKIEPKSPVYNPDVVPESIKTLDNTLLFDNYHEVRYAEPNLEAILCSQKIDDLTWIKLQNPNDISVMHLVELNCVDKDSLSHINSEAITIINPYDVDFIKKHLTSNTFEESNSYSTSTTM